MLVYVALAPDGKTLVSTDDLGKMIVWDVASQKKLHEWQFQTPPGGSVRPVFAPDSRHLGVGTDTGTVYVFRLAGK
jgi:hypothetical protein